MISKRTQQALLIEKMFEAQIEINNHFRKEMQLMVDEINKMEEWINNHDCQ